MRGWVASVLAFCLLFGGGNYTSLVDRMETVLDLYATGLLPCAEAALRGPSVDSIHVFDQMIQEATRRGCRRLIYTTRNEALTLPEGGAKLATATGLRACIPSVWSDGNGFYCVWLDLIPYDGVLLLKAYKDSEENLTAAQDAALRKAKDISKRITNIKNEEERLRTLCAILHNSCHYRKANLTGALPVKETSPIGALLYGKANCQGFADTLRLLCGLSGLRCEMVMDQDHAWNRVRLGHRWVEVDASLPWTEETHPPSRKRETSNSIFEAFKAAFSARIPLIWSKKLVIEPALRYTDGKKRPGFFPFIV